MDALPFFQVDAFAASALRGNPAAVMVLEAFLPNAVMQAIAQENNLSETAFLAPFSGPEADYALRWMTPTVEVPLCGHATLASALVVFLRLQPSASVVRFSTQSGVLEVKRIEDVSERTCRLELKGPPVAYERAVVSERVLDAIGLEAAEDMLLCADVVVVAKTAEAVENLAPDFGRLKDLEGDGVIVTASARTGDDVDFVSRYFVPKCGIDEDPVTGYAHFLVGPYWADRLEKDRVVGRQVSSRPGVVECGIERNRNREVTQVALTGAATLVIEGESFFVEADAGAAPR